MPAKTMLSEYNLLLALASSSTDTAFDSEIPTVTQPAADQIDIPVAGAAVPDNLQLVFIGTSAANQLFDYRVTGWAKIDTLWIPTMLVQGTVTLGAKTGVAAKAVTNSYYFADTLDVDYPSANLLGQTVSIVSPENDLIAHLMIDLRGYSIVTVKFDRDTAASCNALYRFVE